MNYTKQIKCVSTQKCISQRSLLKTKVMKNRIKMQKLNKEKEQQDKDFIFRLIPLRKTCYFQTVSISFKPQIVRSSRNDQDQIIKKSQKEAQRIMVIPKFNYDRKYYTSCFVNPLSLQAEQNDFDKKASHSCRVQQSLTEIAQQNIQVPKPRKKVNNFCSVCKDYYQDYLIHISKQIHKKSLKQTQFSEDIKEIAKKVYKKKNQIKNLNETKGLKRKWKKEIQEGQKEEIEKFTKKKILRMTLGIKLEEQKTRESQNIGKRKQERQNHQQQ